MNNIQVLADELGFIKSQIADLKEKEELLKTKLIEAGQPVVEGSLFRAAVSLVAGRTIVDWEAVALKFEPSRQLITAHTKESKPCVKVLVSARKA